MRLRGFAAFLCLLVWFAGPCMRGRAQTPEASGTGQPAYPSDPKFVAAMDEGKQLSRHRQFTFAADAYRKANKIAGGKCFDCLRDLYTAQLSGGNFKDAAGTASMMEAIASDPPSKAIAQYREAMAIYEGAGDKPKPDKLEAAHRLLQTSVAAYPKNPAALFQDGKVLAQLGKLDEAGANFAQCVTCMNPKDAARLRAEHFAENPELALHKMAPAFEVTAIDGSKFNLDAMGGRVVLIDFWATWCGPCNRELPHMKQLAKQFAGEPLVIISVSWDQDEAKWKDFVAKNDMT